MKKIVVLSDSHGSLDRKFYKHLKDTDEIWHAGDIGDYSEVVNFKSLEYVDLFMVTLTTMKSEKSLKKYYFSVVKI